MKNIKILIVVSYIILLFSTPSYGIDGNNSNIDMTLLKQYLLQVSNSFEPWISRKEIASWSAVVLYFTFIMVILNKIRILLNKKKSLILFLTLTTFLFIIFIHKQFGSMIDTLATQRTINKYLYTIIATDSIPKDFDFKIEENQFTPTTVINEIRNQTKTIRSHVVFKRLILPFIYKLQKDSKTTSVEIEEGVLYDLIIITFIFLIMVIYKCEPPKTKPTERNKYKKK